MRETCTHGSVGVRGAIPRTTWRLICHAPFGAPEDVPPSTRYVRQNQTRVCATHPRQTNHVLQRGRHRSNLLMQSAMDETMNQAGGATEFGDMASKRGLAARGPEPFVSRWVFCGIDAAEDFWWCFEQRRRTA